MINIKKPNKLNSFIFFIILTLFVISSNIAWINPDPRGAIKVLEFPFMWQYDVDAILELGTATYFPDFYKDLPTRIDRPLYPFLSHIIGTLFFQINNFINITNLSKVYFVALAFILLKILIYSFGAICVNKICDFLKFNLDIKKISLIIFFFNPFLIKGLTTFHTIELQLLNPVFAIYFFIIFIEKKINIILCGIFTGLLFLGKNNYAISVAIFLFMVFNKNYKDAVKYFFYVTTPTVFWFFYWKNFMNINFSINDQYANYHWFDFSLYSVNNLLSYLIYILIAFFKNYYLYFISLFMFFIFKKNKVYFELDEKFIFIFLFVFSTSTQMLASNKFQSIYMTSDIYWVYAISFAWLIVNFINYLFKINYLVLLLLSFLLLSKSILHLANFPLINPYNQSVLIDHKEFMIKAKKMGY